MAFDSGIISFTTKTNKVDLVDAAHINAVQAELVTIETILGTNVKGDRTDLKTRLNNALDADGSILSGTSFPSPPLSSQIFFRTDLGFLYVYNGSWQLVGNSLSNCLFQYSAVVPSDITLGTGTGEIIGSAANPTTGGTYRFLQARANQNVYTTVWKTKWTKISGVNTITVYAQLWTGVTLSSQSAFKVDVGGQNVTVNGTVDGSNPEWKSGTIDVSGLSNGTTYDVTVSIAQIGVASTQSSYLGNIMAFGS